MPTIEPLDRSRGASALFQFSTMQLRDLILLIQIDEQLDLDRSPPPLINGNKECLLAATTMEATVDSALSLLLETGQPFDYGEVRELAEPKPPEAPALVLTGKPDLKIYDDLLTVSLAGSGVCG